ncbi:sugar phosphate nucleotidyltransferase [Halopiger xanaduensis]|uniref:Nucleotidyl transferase n=1 Tax=Halopiger xanaduensis (strain DSM 18323 / JCM 14033 / SH-6) TaxID=797210 RepID=F8DE83_HALXS|nr:NDP-sugar synthase [Halopiger xanaduensis]AEH39364.1 Nucleotidyl transferase [Halopiger xanaduensis SH-6]
MEAVVLAGGYATRLWPITRDRPKMLLPLGETTVIDRLYADLESVDRIETVYVSTNERFADDFEAHLAERSYDKPRLSVEETQAEDEKFGVIAGLAELVEREGVDDDLLVIAGDNVFEFAIRDFLEYYDWRDAPTIAATDVGSPERATEYGVLDLADDRVVNFREKPDDPPGTCVSVGCYAFPRETLSLLPQYLEAGNDPDEPGWFVQWLRNCEPTYAYTFDGAWFDIGTRERYLDAVAWHLDGESRIVETVSLKNATIGSDVHVMANATLVGAEIERAVVFPDVTLEGTTVHDSIIDEGATLGGIGLHEAMVGAYSRIPGSGWE